MKSLLAITAMTIGLCSSSGVANAGGVQLYLGSGVGNPGGYYSTFPAYPSYGLGGGYGYSVGRSWHNTGHYDYYPGGYVRHRNHYHYTPGHYHYHNNGHWDRYRGGHRHHH